MKQVLFLIFFVALAGASIYALACGRAILEQKMYLFCHTRSKYLIFFLHRLLIEFGKYVFFLFEMEIVCAGYPKTASKSCSNALRVLGYNVADWVETAGFLSNEWLDFIDGKTSIEPVME